MFCFFEVQCDMPRPIREPINQPLERRSSTKEDAIKEPIRAYQENKETSQPVEKKDVEKKDIEKKNVEKTDVEKKEKEQHSPIYRL